MSTPTGAAGPDGPAGAELVAVHLLRVPVALHARAQEHGEALGRELRLIAEQLRPDGAGPAAARTHAELPSRLVELVALLGQQYSGFTVEQEDALEAAAADGVPELDLVFRVPSSAGAAAVALGAVLAEADEYCRAGQHLLTLATPPDLVTYREWYLDEFTRQIAGAPPRPWPDVTAPSIPRRSTTPRP